MIKNELVLNLKSRWRYFTLKKIGMLHFQPKKRVFDLGGSLFGSWVAIKSIYLSNKKIPKYMFLSNTKILI